MEIILRYHILVAIMILNDNSIFNFFDFNFSIIWLLLGFNLLDAFLWFHPIPILPPSIIEYFLDVIIGYLIFVDFLDCRIIAIDILLHFELSVNEHLYRFSLPIEHNLRDIHIQKFIDDFIMGGNQSTQNPLVMLTTLILPFYCP